MSRNSVRQLLLENIHKTDKHLINSSLFREPTQVVRLDYLGAPDYFVTDRGYVYNRKANNTNKAGILTRGYLPLTHMDSNLPYPWIYLPTDYGQLWFPINQLLGWSFATTSTIAPTAYVTTDRKYSNQHYNEYEWVSMLPNEGFFKAFMTALYR